MKSILPTLILFSFTASFLTKTCAQGENDNWIFGSGCHLSFRNGFPEIRPSVPQFKTQEGCTTVSDENGNLLFYSDGIRVWNRYHEVMQNGYGLLGHPSSTTSCVIVPQPENDGMYYIFCVDANQGSNRYKFTYNIVDIRMNAGRGSVIRKNEHIVAPCDEKIAVTRHCNGKDFWIVTHLAKSNVFAAYMLSGRGLSSDVVYSSTQYSYSPDYEIGYLKFSPDGQFLASANGHSQVLEILRFDKQNGNISDWTYDREISAGDQSFYGLAFSASGRMLYASLLDRGKVFQYDLSLPKNDIRLKKTLIISMRNRIGGMQLAKDNRIYISNGYSSPYLNRINNPDMPGMECTPELKALHFDRGTQLGLPSLVESPDKYFDLGKDSVIDLDEYTLTANIRFATYLWSTGDTSRQITVHKSGMYWVWVFDRKNCLLIRDTINIQLLKKKNFILKELYDTLYVCSGDSVEFQEPPTVSEEVEFTWKSSLEDSEPGKSGTGMIPAFRSPPTDSILTIRMELIPNYGDIEGASVFYIIVVKPVPVISCPDEFQICGGNPLPGDLVKVTPAQSNTRWTNNNVWPGIPGSGLISDLNGRRIAEIPVDTNCLIRLRSEIDGCFSQELTCTVSCLATPVLKETVPEFVCPGETLPEHKWDPLHSGTAVFWRSDVPGLYHSDSGKGDLRPWCSPYHADETDIRIKAYPVRNGCLGKSVTYRIGILPRANADFLVIPDSAFVDEAANRILFRRIDRKTTYSSWTFQDGNIYEADSCIFTFNRHSAFSVTHFAQNSSGCSDTSVWHYIPSADVSVFIPNALNPFSLHGNHTFNIAGQQHVLECCIYNRWGELIFRSNDGSSWDGTYQGAVCPQGVYVYTFLLLDHERQKYEMKGTVHLIY